MTIEIIQKMSRDSSISRERRNNIDKMLQIYIKYGFKAHLTYPETLGDIISAIDVYKPDLVFCALDHIIEKYKNNNITHNVHKYFEMNNVNYIGSSSEIIELALSKSALKIEWEKHKINTPPFVFIGHHESNLEPGIKKLIELGAFPYILKPENLGNSRGIDDSSIVHNAIELTQGLARLRAQYQGAILIEHYLGEYRDMMEITCAMIGEPGSMRLMPAQIVLKDSKKHHLVTTEDKDQNRTILQPLPAELRAKVIDFAKSAFEVAGVRDYARGDFFFADGKLWAIEINGQPMIPDQWFADAAEFDGLTEEQYLVAIVAAGYRRLKREGKIDKPFPEAAEQLLKEVF